MRRASIHGLAGLLIAVACTALAPSLLLAQHRLIEPESRHAEGERLRQRVATVDSVITLRTRRVHDGRVDVQSGLVRARYRIDADDRRAARRGNDPFSFLRPLARSEERRVGKEGTSRGGAEHRRRKTSDMT